MRGVDHFLRYPSYVQTPAELLLGVVSILGLVLEMIALSLGPLLLYVLILGRPSIRLLLVCSVIFAYSCINYIYFSN